MDLPQPTTTTRFTDAKGREWDCTLTLAAARRVDDSDFTAITGFEFSVLRPDRQFFIEILTDTRLLFAVIWAVVYPQASRHEGFPDAPEDAEREFTEGLDGDALERGREAFWEAISRFFPQQRNVLSTLMRQFRNGQRQVAAQIQGMEAEIDKMIQREVEETVSQVRTAIQSPSAS